MDEVSRNISNHIKSLHSEVNKMNKKIMNIRKSRYARKAQIKMFNTMLNGIKEQCND
jgi:peptidoglycan hydrolase CwlO-like protein